MYNPVERIDLKHWLMQLKDQKANGFTWFQPQEGADINEHIVHTKIGIDMRYRYVDEVYSLADKQVNRFLKKEVNTYGKMV